jgi:hypothetical protein
MPIPRAGQGGKSVSGDFILVGLGGYWNLDYNVFLGFCVQLFSTQTTKSKN